MPEIAFLGDRDIIEGWTALGAAAFPVHDIKTLAAALKDIFKRDYGVLFVTEAWAEAAEKELTRFSKKGVFPIVVVIPDTGEKKGVAERHLKRIAEMAVGRDTLFESEE